MQVSKRIYDSTEYRTKLNELSGSGIYPGYSTRFLIGGFCRMVLLNQIATIDLLIRKPQLFAAINDLDIYKQIVSK
jgi:hypothetical protein